MEFENEKNQDQLHEEQKNNSREGFQKDYRPVGRSPRPRIHTNTRPGQGSYERNNYQRRDNTDDQAFRPEGFGASLQNNAAQRPYRARTYNKYNNGYGQQDGQQRPYQPRPRYYNNNAQQEGPQQGGYQPRPRYYSNNGGGYGQQQGGYQPRPRYGQQPRQQGGGYQQRPYGKPYNAQGNGYGQQKPRRQHSADYDPNAKYSMKKRIEYKEQNYDPNEPIRLNKFLANAGVCSRREADEFIQAGVVTVNGEVVTELGTKVMRTDVVRFHEDTVSLEKKVYVLLNKPKDYVTTSDDPQQRKTVMDLVKDACPERIYPVGRLDRNTTGVLLLTNDGDLASKLTHPKYLKKKIYHVYLDKNVTAHDLQQIAEGITLDDGEIRADDVQYASPTDKKQVGIEIHSGKNRIVRRIFEALGYKVIKLDRVQFAGLTKKNLRRGDWRYLTEEEVDRLRMGAYE
ncbi:MAG: RNA-binding S4 domain-containing protein [Prevotella sp.]|nr:RNA-binding S4 domain-containing protein [Prevotella sp.]